MRTCNGNCIVIPNKLHVLYNFNAARSCNERKKRILYFPLCFLLICLLDDDVSCLNKFNSRRLVLPLIVFLLALFLSAVRWTSFCDLNLYAC